MATKYFFSNEQLCMRGSRFALLVNVLNFVLTDPLCVAPEPGFTHSSVNGRINNNSPARIAFPGWVSLALAAGAAAARLRAPTEGPITPPWSCMITNLLSSLFWLSGGLCSPNRTGAQRAGSRARMMPFQNAHGGSSSSVCWQRADQWRQSRNFGMFYVRRLCLVTMATLCRDSREDDVAQGRAAPGTHGRFQQRTTSVALAPPKAAGRSAAHPSPLSRK